ncbi:MAG: quinone-dependent dihydroorotate dehydrogenase [Candidatus Magasanikbacteria bacterium]|nr:quinone-dependent dihydroorotate dehydrogenase [Candidatus Magasanikbacteria bacterium]
MKEFSIYCRDKIIEVLYKLVIKPILFKQDPEDVHDRVCRFGIFLGKRQSTTYLIRTLFSYKNPILKQNILGIDFSNPIGMGGGFDKNAELTDIIPEVGFGFMEVGSITAKACEGNPKPRLWRLPKLQSLCVWYGLKNDGAEVIRKRLLKKQFSIPLGINIAKTNSKETVNTQAAIEDYLETYTQFSDIGDYDVINVSCPNTFGGEPFTDPLKLEQLLKALSAIPKTKPVFIKLSPELPPEIIDRILEIALLYYIDGFVCTNLIKKTEKNRLNENIPDRGGLSGKAVEQKSTALISYIYKKTKDSFVIIGLGGVFNAEDAYKKIKAGASLVQLITGMIYEGPQRISQINRGLAKLLKQDGLDSISQAIGIDHR